LRLPHFSTASWIWLSSLAALAIAIAWLIWPRAAAVEFATIDQGEVRRELEEEGRVRIRDVFTLTAPVGGLLQRIELQVGDRVEARDVVATIAPAAPVLLDARTEKEANAAITAARSALALAEADAELARSEQERFLALFERGFASKAALDRSRTALSSANAMVNQRKADLQRAIAVVSRPASISRNVSVRSPSSGRVLQILQESEATVAPGAPLLEIGDPAKIEIVAEYLSQDAVLMREGACAIVQSPSGSPMAARVEVVEPYARTKISALGVEEQRVNVVLSLEEEAAARARLGHGYRVDVRVVLFEQKDALRAPTDALVRNGDGGWAVFRIVDGRVRLTPVSIGEGDDRFRVIQEGLSLGDRVVLFPGDALKDGDRVRGVE
jgi:HlyD family secretion protein